MKTNKLKLLSIAICCLFLSLWSKAQCADEQRRNDDPIIRNNQTELSAGIIISFAGEVAPGGWLLCNGQQCSSQEYPELYKVIKTKYVPPQEELNVLRHNANEDKVYKLFYVPDLRGRVIVGVDGVTGRVTNNNALGASGGEESHILTVSELARHNHLIVDANAHAGSLPLSTMLGSSGSNLKNVAPSQETGGDQPHNNMQPYLVLNYIINTGKFNNRPELNRQENEIDQLKQKINQLEISKQKYATMFDDLVVQVRQGISPGFAKAWVVFNGSNPNTLNSYGVSSVVRNSIGNYTINFVKPFSSSDYCSSLSPTRADCALLACTSNQTQQNFVFDTFKILGWVSADPVRISACFYGN